VSLVDDAVAAAEQARELLNPPGGLVPVDDAQRVAIATAQALTSFALVAAAQAQAAQSA
jgi:hypothetical protein